VKVNEKLKELRALSDEELGKRVIESKKELFDLRFKISTGTLEKSSRVDELKKDIARIKTILKERKNNGGEK